jgi:hypothetical protein
MRYRPSALVLGALLVMTLTSFHPVQKPEQSSITKVEIPRTTLGGTRTSYRDRRYIPTPPAEAPEIAVPAVPVQVYLPPDFAEHMQDWSRDAMRSAERMMHENAQVRQMMKQIRYRLREEVRRQQWRQMIAERRARSREFDLIDSP